MISRVLLAYGSIHQVASNSTDASMALSLFPSPLKRPLITCAIIFGLIFATLMLFTAPDEANVSNKQVQVQKILDENVGQRPREETPRTLCEKMKPDYTFEEGQSVFENFNNVTGVNCFIVPNIIHYVRFNQTEYSFTDYIVLLAAMRNHRPDWFYIHTDVPGFTGTYWQKIMDDPDISKRIRIKHIDVPSEIFGQPLSTGWRFFHGGDIARLKVMMQYGGIYLDNDVFVLHNLDKYRKYELAVNWDKNQFLGSQVIIANKDARFLSLWLDTYHEYHSDRW